MNNESGAGAWALRRKAAVFGAGIGRSADVGPAGERVVSSPRDPRFTASGSRLAQRVDLDARTERSGMKQTLREVGDFLIVERR